MSTPTEAPALISGENLRSVHPFRSQARTLGCLERTKYHRRRTNKSEEAHRPCQPAGSCRDQPQYEEQQHVGSSASSSSQMPLPELQRLYSEASRCLPCKEGGLVAEPACGQKLKQHDLSSVKDLLNATTLEELSTTATSSVQMQTQPWRCLSSSPIWPLPRLDWGITFYIRIDLNESYHTYPDVGGPFQSLQAAHNAIDRYLQEHQDPTMFTQQPGVSRLDMVVRQCLNWPDGTRKKLLESQIDERRDWKRQLVQDLVDKYNDYRHLMGDRAYKLKDVVLYNSVSGGNDHSRLYDHINFTMKGAEDSNCGIDDLFFAEVTFKRGEYSELMVSCFCMVKPTDNGLCYGCDVKHPNDAAAYTGAGVNSQRACPIFGNMKWKCRNETLQEEEDRVRNLYKSQGLDAPDYLERVKEEMTLKPFRPKYLDVETMDED